MAVPGRGEGGSGLVWEERVHEGEIDLGEEGAELGDWGPGVAGGGGVFWEVR